MKTGNIIVREIVMPRFVRGQTLLDEDGDYNIYLNSLDSYEERNATLQHELDHILLFDFDGDKDIYAVEKIAHVESD